MLPGENWGEKSAQALEESDAMVVLLTPHSLNSPNIVYEVGYAFGKEDYKDRLIPVVAGPVPTENIPWVLRRLNTIRLDDADNDEARLKKIAQTLKETHQPVLRSLFPHDAAGGFSHSSHDFGFVTTVAEALRRHGVPVWYSRTNILGAEQWHDEIGTAPLGGTTSQVVVHKKSRPDASGRLFA
jgi:hypothetical protein